MRLAVWLLAILVVFLSQPANATRLGAYDYPFVNPLRRRWRPPPLCTGPICRR